MISNSFFLRQPDIYPDFLTNELHQFINKIWSDPAEYKVLMARRMFNLNDALMKVWGSEGSGTQLTGALMSNTGFLLYATSIADRYAYDRKFPRIIICDDIMLHGRGIIRLLAQFRQIISERLVEKGVAISSERIEMDLTKAVQIFVFARNREHILVRRYRISAELSLPSSALRRLSQQISNYLLSCGVANTSYVLTVFPNKSQLLKLFTNETSHLSDAFTYRQRSQLVYVRYKNAGVLETIRLQPLYAEPEAGSLLTSLVIFGDISDEKFDRLCEETSAYIQQGVRYSRLAELLRIKGDSLVRARAQLLSFIYSIASMADFCHDKMSLDDQAVYNLIFSGDIDKILRNFDTGERFRLELLRLAKDICLDKVTGRMLRIFLENVVSDLGTDGSISLSDRFERLAAPDSINAREICENAEDIFYAVGMNAERDAYRYVVTEAPYKYEISSCDSISFENYLSNMKSKSTSMSYSVGYILGMMDSGLLAMNLEMNKKDTVCRIMLKAGELATYVLPRRYAIFFPALAYIEDYYDSFGSTTKRDISRFIEYLQSRCYKQDGKILRRDIDLLKSLKSRESLLLSIYSTGQSLGSWNIDLRIGSDYNYRRSYQDRLFTYEEELNRKDYYLKCAREYLLIRKKLFSTIK